MSAIEAELDQDWVENTDKAVDPEQFLTFIMNDEEYGVDILIVKEIKIWESATSIPRSPAHVRGVINLRGTIVPIIDLRQCFGMPAIEYGPLTVILVLQVSSEKGDREIGIVVDEVSDVHTLEAGQLSPNPEIGSGSKIQCIRGLVSVGEKMVILLDMDELLTQDDFSGISEVKEALLGATNDSNT
ncbi:MAG: chemotaxis protein CheW [Pseudomonadales bacterium]|nr:chemotaxis protein CheW [Pseudomonadales bacterium]